MAENNTNAIINDNGKLVISDDVYSAYRNQDASDKNIDVFSLLGALSENADIFLQEDEKIRYKAMIRYMYSQDEIKKILEENNIKNLDALVDSLQKNQGSPNISASLKSVLNNLLKMQEYVNLVIQDKDKANSLTPPGREHTEKLRLLKSGSLGFVKNILRLNDGKDLEKLTIKKNQGVAPLILDQQEFPTAKTGITYKSVTKHVQKVYGYKVKGAVPGELEHIDGKAITCRLNNDPLTNAVNVLYQVSTQMYGSKNITFSSAKKYLDKNVDEKELEKIFAEKKQAIAEAVSLMTTIFAARFVLDKDSYYLVNRQLSVQLAYKMKELVFTNDGANADDPSVKDAWLIKYIKEKVNNNVTNIVTKNNVHTAQQLASIYAENGTMIAAPENIVTIDDLVFSQQSNAPSQQAQNQLTNAIENNTKPILKNIDFKKIISEIKNKKVKELLKKSHYLKLYKQVYSETYMAIVEKDDIKQRVDKLKQHIQRTQDIIDNVEEQAPEDVVRAQAQHDGARDAIAVIEQTQQQGQDQADTDKLGVVQTPVQSPAEGPQTQVAPTEEVDTTEQGANDQEGSDSTDDADDSEDDATTSDDEQAPTEEPRIFTRPETFDPALPIALRIFNYYREPKVSTDAVHNSCHISYKRLNNILKVMQEYNYITVVEDNSKQGDVVPELSKKYKVNITLKEVNDLFKDFFENYQWKQGDSVEYTLYPRQEVPVQTDEEAVRIAQQPVVEENTEPVEGTIETDAQPVENTTDTTTEVVAETGDDQTQTADTTEADETDATETDESDDTQLENNNDDQTASQDQDSGSNARVLYTEPKPQTAEELYEAIKKTYLSMLKGKNVQAYLNLRSTVDARIQDNKQTLAGQKVKSFMIEQIATTLAERTCVYYDKAKRSKNIEISDRPRAIISCFSNEVLLGKSLFASNWRKNTNAWLAVMLAKECNSVLNQFNLEYAVDEKTYATVTKKYELQMANFVKALNKRRAASKKNTQEQEENNA